MLLVNRLKEKEIKNLVEKFEKIMGPVAAGIAEEEAEKMGILKEGKISVKNEGEYDAFVDRLLSAYSKIIGKSVTERIAAGG